LSPDNQSFPQLLYLSPPDWQLPMVVIAAAFPLIGGVGGATV
jgi:hypothetical protein